MAVITRPQPKFRFDGDPFEVRITCSRLQATVVGLALDMLPFAVLRTEEERESLDELRELLAASLREEEGVPHVEDHPDAHRACG